MKNAARWAGVVVLGLAASGLLACTRNDSTTVSAGNETTGIAVSGHGEATGTPDTAFFNVAVQVNRKTVAEARDDAAKSADAVISSIKQNGIDAKDIQTTGLNIQPEYVYPPNGGTPTVNGYVVYNNVSVKVRKLEQLSKVIDDAVAAGGDDSRLEGIRFDIEDRQKLEAQAREAAMKDARQKGEQLATLGGVKLGETEAITEIVVSDGTFFPLSAAAFARAPATGGGPTPIEAGTGKITIDVTVRWAIAK